MGELREEREGDRLCLNIHRDNRRNLDPRDIGEQRAVDARLPVELCTIGTGARSTEFGGAMEARNRDGRQRGPSPICQSPTVPSPFRRISTPNRGERILSATFSSCMDRRNRTKRAVAAYLFRATASPDRTELSRHAAQKPQVERSNWTRPMEVVRVEGLGKTYPGGTKALEDVSFSIQKGEIFCLLGRNGAGKTTLLRILATQLKPTLGRASVLGHDVLAEPQAIRPHIAVVPQEARPQMLLSPYDHILYFCLIRGQSRAQARERTQKVMEDLGLWEHLDKLTSDLSGGLRQRLIIAMAMVADPEVLFLDEPTIGLDPLGRRSVWHMLRELTRKGATILLTTHYLDEAEVLADHLLIVDKGRTAFLGTVDEAKGDTGVGMRVIVEPAAGNGSTAPEILEPKSAEEILAIVERGLREKRKVTFKPASLEDAFIKIVGGSIEVENT